MLAVACGGQSQSRFEGDPGGGQPGTPAADAGAPSSGGAGASAGAVAGTSSGGAGTSAGAVAGTSSGGAAQPGPSVEVVDDVDHTDGSHPQVPDGSSAFFWGTGYRLGNWFTSAPAPNPFTRDAQAADIVPPRGSSTRAYRVVDSGRERGVDLWAQLDHPNGRAVDLSGYAGITFWARLSGASTRVTVGMNSGVPYFDAPQDVVSVSISVTPEWEQFSLPFSTFGIDGHAVASFDFIVGEGGEDFDLWIDDLALLCKGECPDGG